MRLGDELRKIKKLWKQVYAEVKCYASSCFNYDVAQSIYSLLMISSDYCFVILTSHSYHLQSCLHFTSHPTSFIFFLITNTSNLTNPNQIQSEKHVVTWRSMCDKNILSWSFHDNSRTFICSRRIYFYCGFLSPQFSRCFSRAEPQWMIADINTLVVVVVSDKGHARRGDSAISQILIISNCFIISPTSERMRFVMSSSSEISSVPSLIAKLFSSVRIRQKIILENLSSKPCKCRDSWQRKLTICHNKHANKIRVLWGKTTIWDYWRHMINWN